MGRSTDKNRRNRARKQKIKKRIRQQGKQENRAKSA